MRYVPMIWPDFVKSLQDGRYVSITGARRALSKVKSLTSQEKRAGEALIKKKFMEPKKEIVKPAVDLAETFLAVYAEYKRAKEIYPSEFNSAHEGYAILLEEVDELWAEVKKKQSLRDKNKMRSECIQIAAMAVQFALELT